MEWHKKQWDILEHPDLDYSQKRRLTYPDVSDQLDMLWHAIDQGMDLKQSDFYKKNKEVKKKFPKTKS